MSAPPWLPFHVGDYLKNTPSISRSAWEHHGIYVLALFIAWNVPGVRLPIDHGWLASRFGCTEEELKQFVLPILSQYFLRRGNYLYQKRLSREFSRLFEASERQRVKAKSRWNKEKVSSRGIAAAMPESPSGIAPTPTPTPTQEKEKSISAKNRSEVATDGKTQLSAKASPVAVAPSLFQDEKASTQGKAPKTKPNALNGHVADFQIFYDVYPLHKARRAAEKAYASAVKRASPATILEGATRYASDPARKPEYTKQPATWLNADCWLDEVAQVEMVSSEEMKKFDRIEALNRRG